MAEYGTVTDYEKNGFKTKMFAGFSEISEGMAPYTPPVPISLDTANKNYKVLYAVGYL